MTAMRTKPVGESRVPRDAMCGFGFSRSMPDADMRMKLSHNVVRGYRQTPVSNTYEVNFVFLALYADKYFKYLVFSDYVKTVINFQLVSFLRRPMMYRIYTMFHF